MQIIADLHTHTISCGHAYGTVLENIDYAKENGLKYIAITDHGIAMPGASHFYYFTNLQSIPPIIKGIKVLRGAECNIINKKGKLDLEKKILKKLDIVLAGLHAVAIKNQYSIEENTQILINSMKNPYVDIIVHPDNPKLLINPEKIALAAFENNVALELNESSLTITRVGSEVICRKIIKYCVKFGTKISLGSDSHFPSSVGKFPKVLKLIKEYKVPSTQILNFNEILLKNHLLRKVKREI